MKRQTAVKPCVVRRQSIPVLLCKRQHGGWEDALNATSRLPAPPKLVVFSRLADEFPWAEVLNMGGFDVLITPFEPEKVLRVTFAAWSRWECDFAASAAKEANATDRAIESGGRCHHIALSDGRGRSVEKTEPRRQGS